MLVRCGGNVIEIGRRQLVVVTSAGLVSLLVTLYCVSLLYGPNHAEYRRIQPTPIDNILQRVARDHNLGVDNVEQAGRRHAAKNDHKSRRKTVDGLIWRFFLFFVLHCCELSLTKLTSIPAFKQVAQLSLTNPRDALHQGSRQNFKTVT